MPLHEEWNLSVRIIALEEHFIPVEALREPDGGHPAGDLFVPPPIPADAGLWQPGPDGLPAAGVDDLGASRIAAMDDSGIDIQVLSSPGTGWNSPSLAARTNDIAAEAIAEKPHRFRGFATLAVQSPEVAVQELERTVTQLGFVGAMLGGAVNGEYLDHKKYWPIFAKAEELTVPIYLHPGFPTRAVADALYSGFSPLLSGFLATSGFGWHVDAGLHALRLILAGVFDEFPALQVILGHHGEVLPFIIDRADWQLTPLAKLRRPIGEVFSNNFHVTFSGLNTYPPFAAAYHRLGAERIMFSADYPMTDLPESVAFLKGLPISGADKEKIAYRNAQRLLRI